MKILVAAVITIASAFFFVLTALYCLLAFEPYTYYALIKAPPEAWIPWFASHHVLLFWAVAACFLFANWPLRKTRMFSAATIVMLLIGLTWTLHPFLQSIENTGASLAWGASAILLLIVTALPRVVTAWPTSEPGTDLPAINFSSPVIAAVLIALLAIAGTQIRLFAATRSSAVEPHLLEFSFWSLLTHAALAVTAVAVLNLLIMAISRTQRPRQTRLVLLTGGCFCALFYALAHSFAGVLSFRGWPSLVYAALFAAGLTLTGMAVALPLSATDFGRSRVQQGLIFAAVIVLAALELSLPAFIGLWDWNGVFLHTFTILFWAGITLCVYKLRPRSCSYSVPALLGVLVITVFAYESLRATEIFWSRPLGISDGEIQLSLQQYATRDASFQLADDALGNAPPQKKCGQLCRVLRQYTNMRNAHTNAQVNLVEPLLPTHAARPNIFIFVIDSMRPDYLGAYNPKVDFTPNIDAFARDSVVFRHAYTQYAGTTLSEPAIWAGALLLHAHYLQPFSNVNSLEKLATVDHYQMYVSDDTVLRQLLSPKDNLIKLDANTLWNHYDVCNTTDEFFRRYDERAANSGPIFFYTQPLNVHQFANNSHPSARQIGWHRDGFNARISLAVHQVDECMGNFLANLKKRGLYENSIIVLTSDHGDATGELGRSLHSEIIYPEVMHVPLIIHLPKGMESLHHDVNALVALTDVTPSLYYLLGHRPVLSNPMFGRPLFFQTAKELEQSRRHSLFMASDVRAVYGILDGDGRYFYATYDSPVKSYLYDLATDPLGTHDVLTPQLKQRYDDEILDHLKMISDFYGCQPQLRSLLAAN